MRQSIADEESGRGMRVGDPDPVGWAMATSMDRYLESIFDQLEAMNGGGVENDGGKRVISGDHMIGLCDQLGLPYPTRNRGVYTLEEFQRVMKKAMAIKTGGKFRLVSLNEIVDRMVSSGECQWRMLEAVNRRATATKRSISAVSQSGPGDSVPIALRDIQIENLTREIVQKETKIDALERLCTALCHRVVDMEANFLVSKMTNDLKREKRAKRSRTRSKSRNDWKTTESGLEKTNKVLTEKLDRIAGELTGVKSILTRVQPGVQRLESMANSEEAKVPRKESTESGHFLKDKSISKSSSSCLHHTTVCDSVSDSGCMTDEDIGEEMTSSQISESAIRVETIVLNRLRQCVEAKTAAVSDTLKQGTDGVEMAKNVRQRLQEVSKRLRDTESRLAHLTRMSSPGMRTEPDGQFKVLEASCRWKMNGQLVDRKESSDTCTRFL